MATLVRLCAVLLVAAAACGDPLPLPQPAPPAASPPEPPAAAAFVAAHVRAEPAALATVVSPLYRAEASRRGYPADGLDPLWGPAARLVDFAYVGALEGAGGLVHVLYTARPKRGGPPTTVWRIDLDPAGRVVWAEPVRLLPTERVRRVAAPGALLGVEADDGAGYRALALADPAAPGRVAVVRFLITAADGTATPDPWTFLQPYPLADADGHRALVAPVSLLDPGLSPDERAALAAYLRALA